MSHSCHAGACMFRKSKQVYSVSVMVPSNQDQMKMAILEDRLL